MYVLAVSLCTETDNEKGIFKTFFYRSKSQMQIKSRWTSAPISAAMAAPNLKPARQVSGVRHKIPCNTKRSQWIAGKPHTRTFRAYKRLNLILNVYSACNNKWFCVLMLFYCCCIDLDCMYFFFLQFSLINSYSIGTAPWGRKQWARRRCRQTPHFLTKYHIFCTRRTKTELSIWMYLWMI